MIQKKYSHQSANIQKEHEVLLKISQSIISTLDYEKVLQIISDGMSELLGIETAAIYLLESKDVLYLGATTPPLDPNMPYAFRKALVKDHPHIQKTIKSKLSLFIPDTNLAKLSNPEKEVVLLRNLRSLVFFPFVQEQKVLGVLILGTRHEPRSFTDSEIDLGQTVANQLSIGIQNARLHYDLQIRNKELRAEIKQREKIEQELKNHQDNLEKLVKKKTKALDIAIENLKATNIELSSKNGIIEKQNKELKETLKNLRETQSRLIQSEKMASLGVLTAGVAHEINNPLNFIMGAYEGLKNNLPQGDCKLQKELLDVLKTGLDRAQNIVKSLNQLNRNNNAKSENCSISEIIDNCLIILHGRYKDRIDIRKSNSAKNPNINGNVGNLHQVFLNILTNAIQSINDKGEITISTFSQNNNLVIDIMDTGVGIDNQHISKITDPFFTTRAPGEGIGLGLSIAYRIIQEHNGSLEFESTPNKGTKARITLPIKPK